MNFLTGSIFAAYQHVLPIETLQGVLEVERQRVTQDPHFRDLAPRLAELATPDPERVRLVCSEKVCFDIAESEPELAVMRSAIRLYIERLMPWRVGPYRIFGLDIVSEWQSWKKFDRICTALPTVRGKKVADVGGNNGYFLYRLVDQDPELLLCIDPSPRCYHQFQFLQSIKPVSNMSYVPFGIEKLVLLPEFFDTVLCMGVLYHRRDPLGALQQLFSTLKRGGQLLLETLYVEGVEPKCLVPQGRYAKMSNVWFLPTMPTLEYWLIKAGFREVRCVAKSCTDGEEQRSTVHAPGESLEHFLDPHTPELTVEGYPRPRRVVYSAWRP